MKFFDYIYYRVCLAYSGIKDTGFEFRAACIVAATQCFTILTVLWFIEAITQNKSLTNLTIVIVIAVFFLVFNYIRYIYRESNNYTNLKGRWCNEKNSSIKGLLVLSYILFTTVITFGLAIYIGSKH